MSKRGLILQAAAVNRAHFAMRRATGGKEYQIDFYLLDPESLREFTRLMQDLAGRRP